MFRYVWKLYVRNYGRLFEQINQETKNVTFQKRVTTYFPTDTTRNEMSSDIGDEGQNVD